MTDKFIEEKFKELLYDFGEINWQILTNEARNEYINNDKKFTEKQLKDCRDFVKGLLDELTDKDE